MADSNSGEIDDLSQEISDFSPRSLGDIRAGFDLLASFADPQRAAIIERIIGDFESDRIEIDQLAKEITIGKRDLHSILLAITSTAALYAHHNTSRDEFIGASIGKIANETAESTIRQVIDVVEANRGTLKRSIRRRRLATAVLPSLYTFDIAVELRYSFQNNEPEDSVPIAVVHLDTDVQNQELWLQLSRADVTSLIEKLNDTLVRMDAIATAPAPSSNRVKAS